MKLVIYIIFSVFSLKILGFTVDLSSIQHLLKPVFLKVPPKNLYVTPSEPAIVECIAKQATVLHINCMNDPSTIAKTSTSSLLDQSKDNLYLKKTKKNSHNQLDKISKSVQGSTHAVNLTLREKTVETWFVRQFWCQCEAVFHQEQATSQEFTTSNKSYIEIAYIDKTFKQEPNSASLYLGRYAKLTCIAPDGNPKPKIYWKKDDKKLSIIDSTKIQVSDDGSLVLFSTSLSDNGIYQCVAYNNAGIRLSNEARLEVLELDEGGDWLPWTPWNACPNHCVYGQYCVDKCRKYLRRRSRLCKAVGREKIKCPGLSLQTESCANVCRVDGNWGEWSQWTLCQRNCTRKKTRQCDNPIVQAGGLQCIPRVLNVIVENCSLDLCQHIEIPLPPNRFVFRDMVIYLVLSISLFLLIIIATVVVCFQKKLFLFSNRSEFLITKMDSDTGQFALLKSRGSFQRDSRSESVPTTNRCSNSTPPMKDTSLLNQPLKLDSHSRNSKYLPLQTQSPISYSYKEGCPALAPTTTTNNSELPPPPLVLAPIYLTSLRADDNHLIEITNDGGKLVYGNTGVSVTIMPDSFPCTKGLHLNLYCDYHDDQLKVFDNYTQLSSVICCSMSTNTKLKKPLIFSFPHCIHWKSMSTSTIKLAKKTPNMDWKVSNEATYFHYDEDNCYLMTFEVFSFCLLGCSVNTETPEEIKLSSGRNQHLLPYNFHQPILLNGKRLCIICFLEPALSPNLLQLSCYISIDTKDIRDLLISRIIGSGCKIFDIPKLFNFYESRDNICMSVQCSSPSWNINGKHKLQTIPFSDLWNIKTEPFIKRTVNVICTDSHSVQSLTGIVTVYQDNFYKEKIDIAVLLKVMEINDHIHKIPNQITPSLTLCKFIGPSKTFRLPRATIRELANCLDPPNVSVCQWLMIAKQLGITNNLEYFLSQSSPTTYLMMLWEAKNREETALIDLKSTLKIIGLGNIGSVFK